MEKTMQLVLLDDAAERMETTELNVLMHLKRGFLAGEEKHGQWYVYETSLKDFLVANSNSKVEVVCQSSCCGNGCSSSH